ncbi:hypothetical protein BJF93_02645 [Xaviernesmea oryzae]|uniref:Uncharacterized protein n=1 Tax=Xaviernesmea oryzae TaxID=464029 RepID=A0A1Q9AZ75_9HYPH|nr:hypothetical protein [Xaviernesmea oryzae]OLP60984.1 hypothetical protein BJF93_02645 [Xaviernesmea oryzae]SEL18887.1 hypothetical protein SAMN04487976_106180 [Xaviernesmea oryzae]
MATMKTLLPCAALLLFCIALAAVDVLGEQALQIKLVAQGMANGPTADNPYTGAIKAPSPGSPDKPRADTSQVKRLFSQTTYCRNAGGVMTCSRVEISKPGRNQEANGGEP